MALGGFIKLRHHFHAVAADRITHGVSQALGGIGGGLGRFQIDLNAFGHGRQGAHVEHLRQTRDDAVGGHVLAGQIAPVAA
ncbi:hypothetical protein G6F57_023225 [Rhizopus arrhizus]|nr:hypothetical protein G6F57_023225 [Rhizopus arrhizus]